MWITWWIVTFMGNLIRQKMTGNTRIFKNLSNGVEMYYVNLFSTKKSTKLFCAFKITVHTPTAG